MQEPTITVKEQSVTSGFRRTVNLHIIDIAFLVFLAFLSEQYYSAISTYQVPMWDAAVYLTNARDWLTNLPLSEIYRPPLISWITAGVWAVTGEDWQAVKFLSALFGIGAAVILYFTLRRGKGAPFALGVVVLTMLNPQVFFYSTQLYTESLSLFFALATLYLVKGENMFQWFLAGASVGLTFASRYPIVLAAVVIVLVESYARRNWQILATAISGAIPVVAAVVISVFIKTGTFQTALAKDTVFTILLSPYYLQNSIVTWGWIVLLVPLAFLLRRTYADRYNYAFIAWFGVSMLFWSANAVDQQLRFTIQFSPAVYFLAFLALEAFVKNNQSLRVFLRRELVLLPKSSVIQAH